MTPRGSAATTVEGPAAWVGLAEGATARDHDPGPWPEAPRHDGRSGRKAEGMVNWVSVAGTLREPAPAGAAGFCLAVPDPHPHRPADPPYTTLVEVELQRPGGLTRAFRAGEVVLVGGPLVRRPPGSATQGTADDVRLAATVVYALSPAVASPAPINHAILMGRLVADPEVQRANHGGLVVELALAVTNGRRAAGGESASFVRVTCWDAVAEWAAEGLRRGVEALVAGRLRQEPYATAAGRAVDRLKVVAHFVRGFSPVVPESYV